MTASNLFWSLEHAATMFCALRAYYYVLCFMGKGPFLRGDAWKRELEISLLMGAFRFVEEAGWFNYYLMETLTYSTIIWYSLFRSPWGGGGPGGGIGDALINKAKDLRDRLKAQLQGARPRREPQPA